LLGTTDTVEDQRAIVGMDEVHNRDAQQVGRFGGAHQARGGGIGVHDDALAVNGDGLRRRLDEHAIALLAFAQRIAHNSRIVTGLAAPGRPGSLYERTRIHR
jgi:hypothetical protein